MILRVYENSVVGTGRHARFTADANRLIEIDNTVCPFEHRCSRARGYTRRMRALITASDLMCTPHLRECANINVFDVGARDREWNEVLRLTCRRACMTTNAASLVDDLGPFNGSGFFEHFEKLIS